MSNLIHNTEKQTLRYWTEDGLPDLYIGLGFIIYGMLTWWSARSEAGWVEAFRSIFLIAMILGGLFLVEKIKMWLTYPRTGYVAYSQPSKSQLVLRFLLGFFISGALVLVMTYVFFAQGVAAGMSLVTILLPLGFGGIMAVIALRQGSVRTGVYALIAVLSGLAAIPFARSLPPADQNAMLNGAAMFVVTGAAMLIGGTLTLVRYLSRHPLPQESES
jgi:MFS family permease